MLEIRKVIDIIPPRRLGFSSDKIAEKVSDNPGKLEDSQRRNIEDSGTKKSRFSWPKFSLILFFLALISLSVFAYFNFSSAEVRIWPDVQNVSLQQRIIADTTVKSSDPEHWLKNLVIPAEFFQDEKSESQQFSATGKVAKSSFSQGQIRIFNSYSTAPQVLVANTRFISAEGKLFRSLEKVTIPGGRYEKEKFVMGFVDISVKAAEEGPEFNIGPSTFSIPGFGGTPKYTTFYGKSFSPMSGGFKGEVSRVTQKDLDEAKNMLVQKLMQESKNSLRNKITSDFVLLDGALKQEILETSSSSVAGAEAETFNYKVRVQSKILVFKKTYLETLAEKLIYLQNVQPRFQTDDALSLGKKIWPGSLKINYSLTDLTFSSEDDQNSGKIILDFDCSAKIFTDIDKDKLKGELKNKSLNEIQILTEDIPSIRKAETKFWPFWVVRASNKVEKIKINLIVDQ